MSRGGRTAAALVAVVVMIGAAVLVRDALKGGDGGQGGRPTLLCAQELGTVCDAIAQRENVTVKVEPAATTADRLAAANDPADAHADGWLTIAPQTGIVNDAQVRNGRAPVFAADETLARSPLVFAASKERLPTLAEHCAPATAINWACLGDVAGHPWSELGGDEAWGRVTLGHADPRANTVGLLAIGQEATSKQQRADFGLADVDDDDFKSWFLELEENEYRDRGGGPLSEMLRFGAGVDVAQVSEAEACSALRGAAQAKNISVVVPTPMTTADVVFAPVRNRAGSDAARAVATGDAARSALADAAWRVGGDAGKRAVCAAVGPVRLTTSSNLPAAGALVALRDRLPSGG